MTKGQEPIYGAANLESTERVLLPWLLKPCRTTRRRLVFRRIHRPVLSSYRQSKSCIAFVARALTGLSRNTSHTTQPHLVLSGQPSSSRRRSPPHRVVVCLPFRQPVCGRTRRWFRR